LPGLSSEVAQKVGAIAPLAGRLTEEV